MRCKKHGWTSPRIAKPLAHHPAPPTQLDLMGTRPKRPSKHLYGAGKACRSRCAASIQGPLQRNGCIRRGNHLRRSSSQPWPNIQPSLCLCRCGILAASVGWRRRTGMKCEPEAYGSRCHQIAPYRPCRRVTAVTRLTDVIWARALEHVERHALIHRDPETSTRSD